MQFLEKLSVLWGGKAKEAPAEPAVSRKPSAPGSRSVLDCRPDVEESEIPLGVKYASRYSWHILPPAGWRRQESISGPVWPMAGSSPTVTFVHGEVKPPESAMIRWHLLSVPETPANHEWLEELIRGKKPLNALSVAGLQAPGLVAGMKVQKVERVSLGGADSSILVAGRVEQCGGEPTLLRYVLILPDRRLDVDGQPRWYRETVQFVATEKSFFACEPVAVASLKSFRRTADEQTISGTFAAVTASQLSHVSM